MSRQGKRCKPPRGIPAYADIYRAYEDGVRLSQEEALQFAETAKEKRKRLVAAAQEFAKWVRQSDAEVDIRLTSNKNIEDCLDVSSGLKIRLLPVASQNPLNCTPPPTPPLQVPPPVCPVSTQLRWNQTAAECLNETTSAKVCPARLYWNGTQQPSAAITPPSPIADLLDFWTAASEDALRPNIEATFSRIERKQPPGKTDLFRLGSCRRRDFCWRFDLLPAPPTGSWQAFAEKAIVVDSCELMLVESFATRFTLPAPEIILQHWQYLWEAGYTSKVRAPPSRDSILSILHQLERLDLVDFLTIE